MIYFFLIISNICLASLVPNFIQMGHVKSYTAEERGTIQKDLSNIDRLIFSGKKPSKDPVYVATAGAPGACKTTILENFLTQKAFKNTVYVDPDARSLRFMAHTYLSQSLSFYTISTKESYAQAQRDAYTHWRGASNYIAITLLNKAFDGGYNIAHGTTSTSPAVEKIYKTLKDKGYSIHLILCGAPDKARFDAVAHRSKIQANYQSTPEDALNKGDLFPQRFPVYFQYGDVITFYWTHHFTEGNQKVAQLDRDGLKIFHKEGFSQFEKKYENDRKRLKMNLPSLKNLINRWKVFHVKQKEG